MVDVARKRVGYAEYIAIANDSPVRYEYIAGEIVAMSGGTIAHGRLIGRAVDALNRALDGTRCVVLPSDLRVRIRSTERSTYPDLHVVCGPSERLALDSLAIELAVDVLYVDRIGPIVG